MKRNNTRTKGWDHFMSTVKSLRDRPRRLKRPRTHHKTIVSKQSKNSIAIHRLNRTRQRALTHSTSAARLCPSRKRTVAAGSHGRLMVPEPLGRLIEIRDYARAARLSASLLRVIGGWPSRDSPFTFYWPSADCFAHLLTCPRGISRSRRGGRAIGRPFGAKSHGSA